MVVSLGTELRGGQVSGQPVQLLAIVADTEASVGSLLPRRKQVDVQDHTALVALLLPVLAHPATHAVVDIDQQEAEQAACRAHENCCHLA